MVNFKAQMPRNTGKLLLGIWLAGMGAVPLLKLDSTGMSVILGIVLVAAGVCTLLGR